MEWAATVHEAEPAVATLAVRCSMIFCASMRRTRRFFGGIFAWLGLVHPPPALAGAVCFT